MIVSLALHELGYSVDNQSIRLDSGDLAGLSIFAKNMFKEIGDKLGVDYSKVNVIASNDINEKTIRELMENKH